MINGGYDRESGEEVIAEGKADSVAYGIPFIANPDLPQRFLHDQPLAEADKASFYTSGEQGYTTYTAYS